ncbi:hypothetical protein J3R83DRAFT_8708 [Lanmaoa asiatica]|nr:hypothetical protein J3R83DRAFT_8708 [Lanmaoa asiatica]
MDTSEVYRIAIVLHPHHKLEYFKSVDWDDEWVQTAEKLVHDHFDHSYAAEEEPDSDIEVLEVHHPY